MVEAGQDVVGHYGAETTSCVTHNGNMYETRALLNRRSRVPHGPRFARGSASVEHTWIIYCELGWACAGCPRARGADIPVGAAVPVSLGLGGHFLRKFL